MDLVNDIGDKALKTGYDHWLSMVLCDRSKIHADLTRTYKNVRLGVNGETRTEGTGSPERPVKLLSQRKHPTSRPRIDFGKTSRAVAAKTFAAKLRFSRPGARGDSS